MINFRIIAVALMGTAGTASASMVTFDATVGASFRVISDPSDPIYQTNFPNQAPDFNGLVFERSFETRTPLRAVSTGPVSVDTEASTDSDIDDLTASVEARVSGTARDGATISIPDFDAKAGFIVENTTSETRSFIAQVESLFDYSVRRSSTLDTALVSIQASLLDQDTGDLSLEFTANGSFRLQPGRPELTFELNSPNSLGFNYILDPGDRYFVGVGVGGFADILTTDQTVAAVPLPAGAPLLAAGIALFGLLRRRQA